MKLFFKQLIFFILIVSIIIGAIEWKYRHYTSPIENSFLRYELEKDSISLLYIGNSHMGAFKKAKINDTDVVGNLSIGGQDLFHIKILLEKVMPESPKLRTVILGLDYELIGYDYEVANQLWKDRLYYNYTGKMYEQSLGNVLMAKSKFYASNRDLSLLFKKIEPYKVKKNQNSEKENFIPITLNNDSSLCINRAKEHSYTKFDTSLALKNASYFEDIILLCNKSNVELICLNPPKQKLYTSNYNPVSIQLANEHFQKLIQKHKVKYINLWENPKFNTSDFHDADHLNKKGIAKVLNSFKK